MSSLDEVFSFFSIRIFFIVYVSIIATASLRRPSPNIIEKSFGYSSNLTIVIAAIISDEHRIEHKYIIIVISKSNYIVLSGFILSPAVIVKVNISNIRYVNNE